MLVEALPGGAWMYGALAGLAALNVVATLVLARRLNGPSPAADGPVACSECGAENDGGYRYCRGCAAELPGTGGESAEASGADGQSL